MRVVSGKYRGKRFNPPKNFPSRPTTDFAKESLFNILNNRVDFESAEVLDLFAGTGNISIEFLSRDCASVLSIDNHPVSIRFLNKMAETLQDENWSILRKNAFTFLENCTEKFDIIFADPPYSLSGIEKIPGLVFENELLNSNGLLIIEHGKEINFSEMKGFTEERNYGGVHFSFFENV